MSPPRRVYFCTTDDPHRKTNAAVLVGALCVMHLGRAADDAYRPLLPLKPFAPFRDASCGPSTYHLTVLDCLRGLQRARDAHVLDFRSPAGSSAAAFDCEAYEHYERVENGDLNWAVPGKIIAFSGPHARRTRWAGFQSLTPEDYWEPFKQAGVTAIIRLNKRLYDRRRFTEGGFRHHELYFPDGSCPTGAIVDRFCSVVEAEPGVVAVHCKAGLGRTGVLIGLYIMKHYGFTANEALGYLRIVRPGSIIGPQQHFLRDRERRMWASGDAFRRGETQPQQLPPPRISHGGGGAYDDGDISDEDAHVADDDDYDDGGYTCGSPATAAAADELRLQHASSSAAPSSAASTAPLPPPAPHHLGAPLPSALRTSPTKPMHSGTRPSQLAGGSSTLPPQHWTGAASMASGSSTLAGAPRTSSRGLGGIGGSVSGDEGSSQSRRASSRTSGLRTSVGALGDDGGVAGYISDSSVLQVTSVRWSGTATSPPAAGTASGGVYRSTSLGSSGGRPPSGAASPGSAERLGAQRRSNSGLAIAPPERARSVSPKSGMATPSTGRSGEVPATTPPAGVLRTISALSPGSGGRGSGDEAGGATPSSVGSDPAIARSGSLRLVTASGQPRKLPAAAAATATYANAYIGTRSPPQGSSPSKVSPLMAALSLSGGGEGQA